MTSRLLSITMMLFLILSYPAIAEHRIFPAPGDEVWELVSDTGVITSFYSDRCSAVDGRNRLYICDTFRDSAETLRRWDGEFWKKVEVDDDISSICAGPDNIILLGEKVNLGYVQDDEYRPIEMGYWYSDYQFTTCFEDDTWALSSGPEDGLQRTNWRVWGGGWLDSPGSIVYEIDAWGAGNRWARTNSKLYYQANDAEWTNLTESMPAFDWQAQVEPYGENVAWAIGGGDLYHHDGVRFYNLFDEGYPIPNGPIDRIAIDRRGSPWCSLGNGQIARLDDRLWTHYTCDFLSGRVRDMTFDHFENLYVITDEMVVMMRNDWYGSELDFQCQMRTYQPGETVTISAVADNSSCVGVLTDIYIAYQNKDSGELLFLPEMTCEPNPVLADFWAKRLAPIFIGTLDIGLAPDTPGEYMVLIGFMFEGRLDLLSSNIDTFDITVGN